MMGILGGTFDPPHKAHLEIANYLLKNIPLEKVIFMPCYLPVLKESPHTNTENRFNMVKLAISKNLKLEVDSRELNKQEPSYSINTLKSIRQEIGNAVPLCFIMGSDAFNQFLDWKDWQGILRLCHIIVIQRPGYELNMDKVLLTHFINKKEALFKSFAGKIFVCKFPVSNISSTQIREEIIKGVQGVEENLPNAVWDYIVTYKLYNINKIK